MAAAARVVGSVLVIAAAEIGGQVASCIVTGLPEIDVTIAEPPPSAASAIDFLRECEALIVQIDELPERMADPEQFLSP